MSAPGRRLRGETWRPARSAAWRAHSIAAGMLVLGVVMTLEERERSGERLRRSLGVALLAAAVLTLVWAV